MAITHKQLVAPQTLTATVQTLYTVPASTKTQLRAFSVTNTTVGAVELQAWLVASGSSAGAGNLIEKKTLGAGETYLCLQAINQILPTGSTIQALGEGLTLMASGAEIV